MLSGGPSALRQHIHRNKGQLHTEQGGREVRPLVVACRLPHEPAVVSGLAPAKDIDSKVLQGLEEPRVVGRRPDDHHGRPAGGASPDRFQTTVVLLAHLRLDTLQVPPRQIGHLIEPLLRGTHPLGEGALHQCHAEAPAGLLAGQPVRSRCTPPT